MTFDEYLKNQKEISKYFREERKQLEKERIEKCSRCNNDCRECDLLDDLLDNDN